MNDLERARFTESDQARFWSYVALPDAAGCMLWTGAKVQNQYGCMRLRRIALRCNRISLLLAGELPDRPGLDAAHKPEICHNPSCVAPSHLRWATRAENQADRIVDGTTNRGERHGMAKLTWDQVDQIRATKGSTSGAALARRFDVSQATISEILTGKSWRNRG